MSPKRQPPARPPLPANMPTSKTSAPLLPAPGESLSCSPVGTVALVPIADDKLRMNIPEIEVTSGYDEETKSHSTPVSDEELSEECYSGQSSSDASSTTDLEEREGSANLSGAGLCSNCNDTLYHQSIFQDGEPGTSLVACERCGLMSTTKYEGDAGTSKSRVHAFEMLQQSDHVAWRRSAGAYWHHGIVEDVDRIAGRLLIINYNGDTVKRDGHYASVRREWVSTNLRKRNLYRIDYRPGQCFSPDVVLARAVNRLGEAKYNPFTENCEHFARWCKTGQHRSIQVETLPQRIRDAPQRLKQKALREKALNAAKRSVDRSFKAGRKLLEKGARNVFSKVGAAVAENAPDVIDTVDRGMDRLLAGISKIEGATTKDPPALLSADIKENKVKRRDLIPTAEEYTNDETEKKYLDEENLTHL